MTDAEVRKLVEDAKEFALKHARDNRQQMAGELETQIKELRLLIVGDGNGRRGLVRTMDDLKRRQDTMEQTGAKILEKLEGLEKRSVPPASSRGKGGILDTETKRLIGIALLAILGSVATNLGANATSAPSDEGAQVTAEAIANKEAETDQRLEQAKKAEQEAEQKLQSAERRERAAERRERMMWRERHGGPSPEPVPTAE